MCTHVRTGVRLATRLDLCGFITICVAGFSMFTSSIGDTDNYKPRPICLKSYKSKVIFSQSTISSLWNVKATQSGWNHKKSVIFLIWPYDVHKLELQQFFFIFVLLICQLSGIYRRNSRICILDMHE